jgi:hypothetical protein
LEGKTMKYSHIIERGRVSVMFAGKPEERTRAMLKAPGFRWSPAGGFWWRRRVEGAADFLAALDRALNQGRPDGACCGSPDGFFRPQGAATPVYCDKCYTELTAPKGPDRFDLAYEDGCKEACGL